MAIVTAKYPDNVQGKYYVDEECIDCNLCEEISPEHFIGNPEGGYHYVKKQPQTDAEIEQVQEALDSCPVEAIGHDGEG